MNTTVDTFNLAKPKTTLGTKSLAPFLALTFGLILWRMPLGG